MTDGQCRDRGESSLLPLYNLPPLLLQPPTSQITPGVDACQLAPGFALPLLSPLSTSILFDLSLLIFINLPFTSSQSHPLNNHDPLIHSGPQLNWRRAPPCFLAAPTLPLDRTTASYPTQSMGCGQATLLAFQAQIYYGLDQLGTTFFQSSGQPVS